MGNALGFDGDNEWADSSTDLSRRARYELALDSAERTRAEGRSRPGGADREPLKVVATLLRDAWSRFLPLTSLEKMACVSFGAVMHLMVLAQLAFIGWLLLIAFRSLG